MELGISTEQKKQKQRKFKASVEEFLKLLPEGIEVICRTDASQEPVATATLIGADQCGAIKPTHINNLNRMYSFWTSVSNSFDSLKGDIPILQQYLDQDKENFRAYLQKYGIERDIKEARSAQIRAQQLMEANLSSSRAIYRDKNKRRISRNQQEWRHLRREMGQILGQARSMRNAAQYGEELKSAYNAHRACQRGLQGEDGKPKKLSLEEQQETCETYVDTLEARDAACRALATAKACQAKSGCSLVGDFVNIQPRTSAPGYGRTQQCRATHAENILWMRKHPRSLSMPLTSENSDVRQMYSAVEQPIAYDLTKPPDATTPTYPMESDIQFVGYRTHMVAGKTSTRAAIKLPVFRRVHAGDSTEKKEHEVELDTILRDIWKIPKSKDTSSDTGAGADQDKLEVVHWFERWNKNWQKGKNDGEEVDFNQDYWNKADKALREYVLTTTQNTKTPRYPEAPAPVRRTKHFEHPKCVFVDRKCLSTRGLKWGTHQLRQEDRGREEESPVRAIPQIRPDLKDGDDDNVDPKRVYAFMNYMFGDKERADNKEAVQFPPARPAEISRSLLEKYARITQQHLTAAQARVIHMYHQHLNNNSSRIDGGGRDIEFKKFDKEYEEFLNNNRDSRTKDLIKQMKTVLQYYHNAHYRVQVQETAMKDNITEWIDQKLSETLKSGQVQDVKAKYMLEKMEPWPNSWTSMVVIKNKTEDPAKIEKWVHDSEQDHTNQYTLLSGDGGKTTTATITQQGGTWIRQSKGKGEDDKFQVRMYKEAPAEKTTNVTGAEAGAEAGAGTNAGAGAGAGDGDGTAGVLATLLSMLQLPNAPQAGTTASTPEQEWKWELWRTEDPLEADTAAGLSSPSSSSSS